MNRARSWTCMTFLAATLVSTRAVADEEMSPKEEAAQRVLRGTKYYQAGDYERAIAEFWFAYKLDQKPSTVYNLGRSYHKTGNVQQAHRFYKLYLEMDPTGKRADKTRAYVAELPVMAYKLARTFRAKGKVSKAVEYYRLYLDLDPNGEHAADARDSIDALMRESSKDAEKKPDADAEDGERSEAQAGSGKPTASDAETRTDVTASEAAATGRPGRTLRIAGIASVAAGAIAIAIGVKYGLDARSLSNELTDWEEGWTDDELAKWDEGERAERNMLIFSGIGAGACVAGGILYFMGRRARGSEATWASVAPMVGPGASGFALVGRF